MPEITISKYEYAIKNVNINAGSTSFELRDGSVTYFFVLHDYYKRRLPFIKICLEIDGKTIGTMYDNKDELMMTFDIYEYQLNGEEEIVGTKLFMQHNFSVIPAYAKSHYITSSDSETEKNVDEMRQLQLFEAYLADMDAVNWFNQQMTFNFKKTSKAAIMRALFQMRHIPDKSLVITPPEEGTIRPYTILELADLVGNVEQMNNRHGVYSVSPFVYYDLEYMYCLNKYKPNIVMPMAEDFGTITFILQNANAPTRKAAGSCNDAATKTHYINLTNDPQIDDGTPKDTSTKFATVISLAPDGKVTKITLDEESTAVKYLYDNTGMKTDQFITEQMTGPAISIHEPNVATSFIKPYKVVTFDVGTQYLDWGLSDHEYRIAYWALSIVREGEGVAAKYIHDLEMRLIQPTSESVGGK